VQHASSSLDEGAVLSLRDPVLLRTVRYDQLLTNIVISEELDGFSAGELLPLIAPQSLNRVACLALDLLNNLANTVLNIRFVDKTVDNTVRCGIIFENGKVKGASNGASGHGATNVRMQELSRYVRSDLRVVDGKGRAMLLAMNAAFTEDVLTI
jgi:hypothetical protein